MGEHLARVPDQRRQQLVLGRRQVHLLAGAPHAPRREVHAQLADLEHRLGRSARRHHGVAQRDPDPGEQLLRPRTAW